MSKTPPSKPWLHPALNVRVSPIEGRGLFAVKPIPAGTPVVVFGGRLMSDTELAELFDASQDYVDTLSIDENLNLVLPGRTPVGLGNHSCDPNLWWADDYTLVTRRPLTPGDEATLDYGTITDADDFALSCGCGSNVCRGLVTGQDWRRPELQDRYGPHWVPVLRHRISRVGQ